MSRYADNSPGSILLLAARLRGHSVRQHLLRAAAAAGAAAAPPPPAAAGRRILLSRCSQSDTTHGFIHRSDLWQHYICLERPSFGAAGTWWDIYCSFHGCLDLRLLHPFSHQLNPLLRLHVSSLELRYMYPEVHVQLCGGGV